MSLFNVPKPESPLSPIRAGTEAILAAVSVVPDASLREISESSACDPRLVQLTLRLAGAAVRPRFACAYDRTRVAAMRAAILNGPSS